MPHLFALIKEYSTITTQGNAGEETSRNHQAYEIGLTKIGLNTGIIV